MKPIPLIRAATVAEIAGALHAQGAPVDGMLEQLKVETIKHTSQYILMNI